VYERYRPEYPAEAVEWLIDGLGIGPGTTVVDLAAGTGKLTRQLVPSGATVIAVEPLEEMRAQLVEAVLRVEVLAGSAEAIPLADASADAVTVASAFHWFDLERALPELHRVLRPGGGLAAIGNARDLSDPLQMAVEEIVGPYFPDAAELRAWRPALEASPLFGPLERREFALEQLVDADGLAGRLESVSYVARLPEDEKADVLRRLRELGEAQPESPFAYRYRTGAVVCFRSDA
jgi:SAM-dependent methyltransferase